MSSEGNETLHSGAARNEQAPRSPTSVISWFALLSALGIGAVFAFFWALCTLLGQLLFPAQLTP